MKQDNHTPPEAVRAAIWKHLETANAGPVSVRAAIRAVRAGVPGYLGSDKELSALVGALATAAGRNVHFDVDEN